MEPLRPDRFFHWAPRVLALAVAGGLIVLMAGTFAGGGTVFGALTALLMQLAPAALFLLLLAVAWRKEWVGAVVFPSLGVAYILLTGARLQLATYAAITGPMFLLGMLFLGDWMQRRHRRLGASFRSEE